MGKYIHSNQEQTWLEKPGGYIGFGEYRGCWALTNTGPSYGPPAIRAEGPAYSECSW